MILDFTNMNAVGLELVLGKTHIFVQRIQDMIVMDHIIIVPLIRLHVTCFHHQVNAYQGNSKLFDKIDV